MIIICILAEYNQITLKIMKKAIKSQLLEFLPTVRFQVPCIDNKISLSLLLNN